MDRIEHEPEGRGGEAVGEEGFGRRHCTAGGQARCRIDDHAPDLGIGEARVEEMPGVLATGDVLEPGRALAADDRGAAAEELREERQRASARIQTRCPGCRERPLVVGQYPS
jgi:hypothetical protein